MGSSALTGAARAAALTTRPITGTEEVLNHAHCFGHHSRLTGQPYPHLETRTDPATGELWVRGPQRFDGYLDPAGNLGRFATARA